MSIKKNALNHTIWICLNLGLWHPLCYIGLRQQSRLVWSLTEAWIKVKHVFYCKITTKLSQQSVGSMARSVLVWDLYGRCERILCVCVCGYRWDWIIQVMVCKQATFHILCFQFRMNSVAGWSLACKHLWKKHFFIRARERENKSGETNGGIVYFSCCVCCWFD